MTDEIQPGAAEAPAPDVDSMNDEEFASFKSEMKAGIMSGPVEPEAEKPQEQAAPDQPPAPASDDDDDDDEPAQHGRSETVSFDRFHRTNERRKEAERKQQELSEKYARLEERTRILFEQQQAAQASQQPDQQAPEVPDPQKDPLGAIEWMTRHLQERTQAEERARVERERAEAETREFEQVVSVVRSDFERANQADPTIGQAYEAFLKSTVAEMQAFGLAEPQIKQQLSHIEAQHIAYIHQNRLNPGEYIKKLASARGWRPAAAQAVPLDNKAGMETIEKREQARQASMHLGKTGGAAADLNKITPQMLAEMSDEDFAAYKEKHGSVSAAFF